MHVCIWLVSELGGYLIALYRSVQAAIEREHVRVLGASSSSWVEWADAFHHSINK